MKLIVHHWDSDGICSASLIARSVEDGELANVTPPLGEYSFDDRVWEMIHLSDSVFVADLNVPDEVERIEKKTTFFDHHLQKAVRNGLVNQVNPSLRGEMVPSCSLVVSRHLSLWSYETVIGTVGDTGRNAFSIPEVRRIMERTGMSESEALRIAELLDSNHITMNRRGVESAVEVLLESDWMDLLKYEPWIRQVEKIEREVERVLSGIDAGESRVFLEFRSEYNIISRVARALVWDMGFEEALVVNRDFNGRVQLYYRVSKETSGKVDMMGIVSALRALGVSAGGKQEVLGSVFEMEKYGDVMRVVKDHLGWFD